jgi:hypothetical protein
MIASRDTISQVLEVMMRRVDSRHGQKNLVAQVHSPKRQRSGVGR